MSKRRETARQRVGDVPPPPAATPTGRVTSPILVGREREFRLLLEAATHPPAVASVEGEAGVGKTRLVQELLAHPELRDRRCYLGGCQQLSEPFPLGPLVEALREARPASGALTPVAGVLRPLLPELSRILPSLPEPLGDRRAERHRLFRALRELLAALGPAVLVLEDLHWADPLTAELLRFLVPQPPPELSLVCTYRREDTRETSPLLGLAARLPSGIVGAHMALRSLDKGQVRELVSTILETEDFSDEFADYVFESSGGLPFAVEELLRLLKDREDLIHRRGVWVRRSLSEMGVPRAVRDSVLERLTQLKPEAQRLVRAAAVLGTPVAEQVLVDVADLPDARVDEILAEVLSSVLLVEVGDGRYGFRHVLARQAVEEAIPSPLRPRLHVRAAHALEAARPRPLARLAHHYRAAGRTKEWIHCAEVAADRASSLEDDATAYGFLKEAVGVAELPAATRGRLAVKLATHARYCLAPREAIQILRRLLEDETLPRGARGEARLWLARLLILEGETAAAYSEIARAAEDLSRRPAHAAQAMLWMAFLGLFWAPKGHVEEQLGWLDRAERTAARSKDRSVRITVAGDRAAFLLYLGDPRGWQAVEEIPQPGPAADELREAARTCVNLADALLHLGHYRRAEEFIREAVRRLAQTRYSHDAFAQRITELQLDWVVGRWDGLEERTRSCLETWADWASLRADAQAVLGLLLLAHGQVQAALRLLEPLAEDLRAEAPVLAWVSGGLARIRLAEGRSEAAVTEAARALGVVQQKGIWTWATDAAPIAVEGLLAGGRHAEALELTRRFARGLRRRDAPAASAALTVCRALLAEAAGELEGAARRYLAAERAWRALPRPYEAARAREGAGRCLLTGGRERGRQLLVEAMDALRELGAPWDAARVRRTLRERGAVPPHRRGRKGYGGELSPRELEAARLAGEGLTNRQIAVAMFVSPKTVEQHLSSAMRKVGVASRTELPERLEPTRMRLAAHS